MKGIKRLLAVMLICAMAVSLLAGCSKDSSDGGKKSGPVELVVFSQLANFSGPIQGWGADLLLDKFNVILNIVPDQNGAMQTRLESGNLGDIVVFGSDGNQYQQAVENGLLLDWNEDNILDDYGSYIKANFPRALEKNSRIHAEGKEDVVHGFGHNLCTEDASGIDSVLYTWDVRWDLYEQLGHPVITDLEDFVDVFVKMKELCPVDENGNPTYAFSMWPDWDGNMTMYVKSTASAYYGYDEFGFGLYDPETGKFYDCLDKEGPYIRALKFYNKLFQNGLIDPDSSTQTYEKMAEKMKAGGVFCSIFNYAGSDIYNTEEHIADNKLLLPLNPVNGRPIVYGLSPQGGNRVWSIGSKSQYPELCMEIIDWLATPEGAMTMWYGIRGECWDYDENGYTYFTELGKQANIDPKGTSMESVGHSGTYQDGIIQINNTTWSVSAINKDSAGEVFDCKRWISEQVDPKNAAVADWRSYTGFSDSFNYVCSLNYLLSPGSSYSEGSRSDDLELKWNEIKNIIPSSTWKAIYAANDQEFDRIVDEMISNAKAHGYDECIEWCENEAKLRYAAERE